jgi:phage shock protein A
MSVFSRLTDVINANLHSLLDKSEEPEKMLRLMIEEMEQVQVEMRTQAARVIAEQKQLERHQLTLREQTAHSRIRARAQVDNQRMYELVARFDGFQNRVDQLEAQLEAATLGQNPSLEAQFRELELNDEIERELARLKGQKVEA